MATIPVLRNGAEPSRSTTTNRFPNLSIAEQGARWLARQKTEQPLDTSSKATFLPRQLYVDPEDVERFLNDDPLVGSLGAAIILGVSLALVKKWRQRDQGPDYYQFEEGGPILYSIRALNEYKTACLVRPSKRGGRR